jgi:hypothetical protein
MKLIRRHEVCLEDKSLYLFWTVEDRPEIGAVYVIRGGHTFTWKKIKAAFDKNEPDALVACERLCNTPAE